MPNIDLNEINWLAVVVAALVAFFIAGACYQLLGGPWAKAQGWSEEKIAELKAKMNPAKFFGGMIFSYLIMAFTFAVIASAADADNLTKGICLGGLAWVIAACVTMTHQLASGRHFNAWLIDAGCEFIYLLAMGAIIGAWR